MTKEQFDSLYLGKAVHCPTEELADEFLELADSAGYTWAVGRRLLGENYFGCYESRTHYAIYKRTNEMVFGTRVVFGNDKNYEIIEFITLKPLKISLLTDEEREFLKGFKFDYLINAGAVIEFRLFENQVYRHFVYIMYTNYEFNGLERDRKYTREELGL